MSTRNARLDALARLRILARENVAGVDYRSRMADIGISFDQDLALGSGNVATTLVETGNLDGIANVLQDTATHSARLMGRLLDEAIARGHELAARVIVEHAMHHRQWPEILQDSLRTAAHADFTAFIPILLEHGQHRLLFRQDAEGALFWAALYERWEMVRVLGLNGAPVGPFTAVLLGDLDRAIQRWRHEPDLLALACRLPFHPGTVSLLHFAIWRGRIDLAQWLLSQGADTNALTDWHENALTLAFRCAYGHGNAYNALAETANEHLGQNRFPLTDVSPHHALESPMVALLGEHDPEAHRALGWIVAGPEEIPQATPHTWPDNLALATLVACAQYGRHDAVTALLARVRPGHAACEHMLLRATSNRDAKMIRLLVEHFPETALTADVLRWIASLRDPDLVECVFRHATSALSALDSGGYALVHHMVTASRPDSLQGLRKLGVDANSKRADDWAFSPLHLLAMRRRWTQDDAELLQILLDMGADLSETDALVKGTPAEWFEFWNHPADVGNPFLQKC